MIVLSSYLSYPGIVTHVYILNIMLRSIVVGSGSLVSAKNAYPIVAGSRLFRTRNSFYSNFPLISEARASRSDQEVHA